MIVPWYEIKGLINARVSGVNYRVNQAGSSARMLSYTGSWQ